jgi:hypothetical protein
VRERADRGGHHPVDIALEKLRHDRGQGNVACLAPLRGHIPEPPVRVDVPDTQRRHRLAAHPGVAENQKEREVPHPLALLGRLDECIHDRRSRDLPRCFAAMGRAVDLRYGVGDQRSPLHEPGAEA